MKTLPTLLILLLSCAAFPQDDTPERPYMAKLKPGIAKRAALVNNDTIFVAGQNRLMLYNPYAKQAFIADGRSGYIPEKDLQRVDTGYFKFNYSESRLALSDNSLLVRFMKKKEVDLQALSQKVIAKDPEALKNFFGLRYAFDALTETYWSHLWKLLNLWTDRELHDFIQSLEGKEKSAFIAYITNPQVTFPVERPMDYYTLHYPKTYELMKESE